MSFCSLIAECSLYLKESCPRARVSISLTCFHGAPDAVACSPGHLGWLMGQGLKTGHFGRAQWVDELGGDGVRLGAV